MVLGGEDVTLLRNRQWSNFSSTATKFSIFQNFYQEKFETATIHLYFSTVHLIYFHHLRPSP